MNTYEDCLLELRNELQSVTARASDLRKAVAAIEALAAVPATRGRRRPAQGTGDVPAELAGLSTPERILHVMAAQPHKRWTNAELSSATCVVVGNTLHTATGRLAKRGSIVADDAGRWMLAESATPISDVD